jgi:DNA-binding NarL/FixJ family response regulator
MTIIGPLVRVGIFEHQTNDLERVLGDLKERVTNRDELIRALQEVSRGGSALEPKVSEVLLARKSHEEPAALFGLSAREREVLQQMATGRNNRTIAKTLYMSDRAVEKHIGSIFQKLGLIEEQEVNRRIMAVLAFLEATGPARCHSC